MLTVAIIKSPCNTKRRSIQLMMSYTGTVVYSTFQTSLLHEVVLRACGPKFLCTLYSLYRLPSSILPESSDGAPVVEPDVSPWERPSLGRFRKNWFSASSE